jgi:SAM-dependent methyltransferase
VDGVLTVAFGRGWVRLFEVGPEGSSYRQVMRWWRNRPSWLLRVPGLLEAGLGFRVLGTAPLSISEIYSPMAGPYARIETAWRDILYRDAHQAFDEAVVAHLPPDGDVLDLDCGTGANLARLRQMNQSFGSYTGVDRTPELLARAREKTAEQPSAQVLRMDLERDTLPEGPFALTVSTWVFEHLVDPLTVVQKAWDRLRSGGAIVLLFEVPGHYWWSRVENRILHFFSADQVSALRYKQFPGLASVRIFRGLFGDVGLFALCKP